MRCFNCHVIGHLRDRCPSTFSEQSEDILEKSLAMGYSKESDTFLEHTIPLDQPSTFGYLSKLQSSFPIILKFMPKEYLVNFMLADIDGHNGKQS